MSRPKHRTDLGFLLLLFVGETSHSMPFGVSSLEDPFKNCFRDNRSLQESVDLFVKRSPGIHC